MSGPELGKSIRDAGFIESSKFGYNASLSLMQPIYAGVITESDMLLVKMKKSTSLPSLSFRLVSFG